MTGLVQAGQLQGHEKCDYRVIKSILLGLLHTRFPKDLFQMSKIFLEVDGQETGLVPIGWHIGQAVGQACNLLGFLAPPLLEIRPKPGGFAYCTPLT